MGSETEDSRSSELIDELEELLNDYWDDPAMVLLVLSSVLGGLCGTCMQDGKVPTHLLGVMDENARQAHLGLSLPPEEREALMELQALDPLKVH